jgi:hypothetical protein
MTPVQRFIMSTGATQPIHAQWSFRTFRDWLSTRIRAPKAAPSAGIVHGDDASFQTGARRSNRPMQIMREGGISTAAREMIADDGDAFEGFHHIVPVRQLRRGRLCSSDERCCHLHLLRPACIRGTSLSEALWNRVSRRP